GRDGMCAGAQTNDIALHRAVDRFLERRERGVLSAGITVLPVWGNVDRAREDETGAAGYTNEDAAPEYLMWRHAGNDTADVRIRSHRGHKAHREGHKKLTRDLCALWGD